MKEDDAIEFIDLGMKSLFDAITGKIPYVKVGILGDKTDRKGGAKTNAEIGARHEFGEEGRSFLRMPLIEEFQKYLDKAKVFDEETLIKVIEDGKLNEWITKIGIVAEQVIGDAFATGGFGRWKPSNMKYKKVHQTLVETTQLRDSITSEVFDD